MNWLSRMQSKTIGTILVTVLGLFGTGYIAFAMYLGFGLYYLPYQAALLTASVFFVILFFVWLICLRSSSIKPKEFNQTSPVDEQQAMLTQLLADPELEKWVRKHPFGTLAVTTLAGVAIGYSSEARELLKTFSQRNVRED